MTVQQLRQELSNLPPWKEVYIVDGTMRPVQCVTDLGGTVCVEIGPPLPTRPRHEETSAAAQIAMWRQKR